MPSSSISSPLFSITVFTRSSHNDSSFFISELHSWSTVSGPHTHQTWERPIYNSVTADRTVSPMRISVCICVCRGAEGGMGNYALLHCIAVWRKSPIEALSPSFSPLFLPRQLSSHFHPSISSCLIFDSSWLSLPLLFSPSYFTFFPLSISVYHLVLFSHHSSRPLSFSSFVFLSGFWWGEQRQEAAWLLDNGTHQNKKRKQHQPHQLHTHTCSHTQTEQDKQDIPAAGCTGFLALANLKRRVRLGVEQSGEAGWELRRSREDGKSVGQKEREAGIMDLLIGLENTSKTC